jgi:hypothetical protein
VHRICLSVIRYVNFSILISSIFPENSSSPRVLSQAHSYEQSIYTIPAAHTRSVSNVG